MEKIIQTICDRQSSTIEIEGVYEKPLSGLWNRWSVIGFSKSETLPTGRDGIFQRFPNMTFDPRPLAPSGGAER